MKKLFAIAFTCVYLTLTVGVVRTTHYCMGRVKTSTLFSFDSVKCQCALFAKPLSKSCCSDDHELIKIDNDQAASSVVSLTPDFFQIAILFDTEFSQKVDHSNVVTNIYESPPPISDVPLFAKHCSLVFYDGLNA